MIGILTVLNSALPQMISLYRMIRDSFKKDDPSVPPTFTDADLIALLGVTADKVVAHADAILAKHAQPEPGPSQ